MTALRGSHFACARPTKRHPLFIGGVAYCMACGRELRRGVRKVTLAGHQVRFPGWTHVGLWSSWGGC